MGNGNKTFFIYSWMHVQIAATELKRDDTDKRMCYVLCDMCYALHLSISVCLSISFCVCVCVCLSLCLITHKHWHTNFSIFLWSFSLSHAYSFLFLMSSGYQTSPNCKRRQDCESSDSANSVSAGAILSVFQVLPLLLFFYAWTPHVVFWNRAGPRQDCWKEKRKRKRKASMGGMLTSEWF